MKFSKLLSLLEDSTIQILQYGAADEAVIHGCQLWTREQGEFVPGFLYYIAEESSPMPPPLGVMLLYKNEEAVPQELLDGNGILILVPSGDNTAEQVFNQIQEALSLNSQFNQGTQLLMDALFSDFGLQHIVDTAFDIAGHPIFVVDTSYRFLAISYKGEIDHLKSPALIEESKMGHISDEGIAFINKVRLDETVRKSMRPYQFYNPAIEGNTLIDTIKIHGIEVARVMMYEGSKPFTRLDLVLMSRLTEIISLELRKTSFFKQNRGMMYSYLLAELLEHGEVNYKSLNDRLQLMGFELRDELKVMVVESTDSQLKNEARLEIIANYIREILTGSMYVVYQDRVVILISRSGAGITATEYARVNSYLKENELVAGMSVAFQNIQDIRRHYRQALKAAELGGKTYSKSSIYRYDDISLVHMFSICEKEEDIINFCSPKLLALLKYDKERGTEMVKTLHQYLLRGLSSRKTADNLHIHKNTLLYRIEKIREIMDSSLDDGDELMQLYLSFRILNYLKAL